MNKCTNNPKADTPSKPSALSQWAWFIGLWCLGLSAMTGFAYLIKGFVRIALP